MQVDVPIAWRGTDAGREAQCLPAGKVSAEEKTPVAETEAESAESFDWDSPEMIRCFAAGRDMYQAKNTGRFYVVRRHSRAALHCVLNATSSDEIVIIATTQHMEACQGLKAGLY